MNKNQPLLECHDLVKSYKIGMKDVPILKNVNFKMGTNETVAIMGNSGSGKSSLLHVLGTLDRADAGRLFFKGRDLMSLNDREVSIFRRNLGFIFQAFHLLPHLTAVENVQWPLIINGASISKTKALALELLESVGLKDRGHHLPSQLSGGEMQRVAIARALVNSPEMILADEPTGNLDSKNGDIILELLFKNLKDRGCSLLMVTHDSRLANECDRIVFLKDGVLNEHS